MNSCELLKIRLYNQLLTIHTLTEPGEIVSWLGAVQAQLLELSKWAIGARLPHSTIADVNDALSSGKILRTHILRPTWHLVAAEDIHWMRELSASRLMPIFVAYGKSWGADEMLIRKTVPRMVKILEQKGDLTKQEISEQLTIAGHGVDQHTLSHALSCSELEGLLCSGVVRGNKHTYALLEERVPKTDPFCKEEALAKLALRFFSSHSPATLQDFTWWSGLSVSEAKSGLEAVKKHFISETMNGRTFWMRNDIQLPITESCPSLLLPAFDEFVVSYKDRSEIIKEEHYHKVMTKNGIFSHTIMADGRIVGSWKRVKKRKEYQIELSFFEKKDEEKRELFTDQVEKVQRFFEEKEVMSYE